MAVKQNDQGRTADQHSNPTTVLGRYWKLLQTQSPLSSYRDTCCVQITIFACICILRMRLHASQSISASLCECAYHTHGGKCASYVITESAPQLLRATTTVCTMPVYGPVHAVLQKVNRESQITVPPLPGQLPQSPSGKQMGQLAAILLGASTLGWLMYRLIKNQAKRYWDNACLTAVPCQHVTVSNIVLVCAAGD